MPTQHKFEPGVSKPKHSGVSVAGRSVNIAFLGDLMFVGEWGKLRTKAASLSALGDLRALLTRQDLVFANLETTIEGTEGHISKQPRVIGDPLVLKNCLSVLGVDIVNLANNHSFDSYISGSDAVRDLLEDQRILYFGAGPTAEEAARPCIVEKNGICFGWLGYASLDTKPSHIASRDNYGVNPLIEEAIIVDVRKLRRRVEHVIVSLHWGIEFCHLPSPAQIRFARTLIDEGVSFVVGHHAHVIQGFERYKNGVIAYNLGNVTTTDFHINSRLAIRQTPRTRSSYVPCVSFTRNSIAEVEVVPIRSHTGSVRPYDAVAQCILKKANRQLRKGLSPIRWRARRLYEDVVLRSVWKLDPKVIRSLRPYHITNFFRNLASAFSGHGPS